MFKNILKYAIIIYNIIYERRINVKENQNITEKIINLLKCPCEVLDSGNIDLAMDKYFAAKTEGDIAGFTPLLILADDILIELIQIKSEESGGYHTYLSNTLESELEDGYTLLRNRFEHKKIYLPKENDNFNIDQIEEDFEDQDEMKAFSGISEAQFGGTLILAKIPTSNPWEIFAWIPFGGWNECPGDKEHMAIAKYWFEKYNAVPALISHDIVDYYLPASQSDKNIAREIAEEQFGYCEDIVLQGCENITFLEAIILNSQIWSFWWD